MNKRVFLAFAAIAGFALAAFTALPAKANTLDDIKASGKLRVCTGGMGLKPYLWQDANGNYAGFENDDLKYILKKIGVQNYEYVLTEWQSLIPALNSKRCDAIMSGVGITQQRMTQGKVKFSYPYFLLMSRVVVLADSPYQKDADLKGKPVASVLGSMDSLNAHDFAKQQDSQVMDFNTWGEPFVALRNKQVDAVVIDQLTYLGQMQGKNDLRVIGDPIFYKPTPEWAAAEEKADYRLGASGIVVRQDDTELLAALNAAIKDMYADGTHEKILKAYDSWDPQQANPMK